MGAPNTTPGPWVVLDDDSFDGCNFIPIETDQPTGPLCRLICEVRPAESDLTAEDRANAHQMAASGALYDALMEISDMLMSRPDILRAIQPLMGPAEHAAMKQAASALALARSTS